MIGKTSEERSELLDSSTSPIHTESLYFQMWTKSCSCLTELYSHANRLSARKVDRKGASCCIIQGRAWDAETNHPADGWKGFSEGAAWYVGNHLIVLPLKRSHCGLHYLADLQSMGCHECLLMFFLIDILRAVMLHLGQVAFGWHKSCILRASLRQKSLCLHTVCYAINRKPAP